MIDDKASGGDRPKFDLHGAFLSKEQGLRNDLGAGAALAGHPGIQGQGTEDQWHQMLVKVLPKRYEVSAAIVVDSEGHQSDQIDLVIRDSHFSPLFWEWGGHLYVPVESVYAVFEVKPEMNREHLLYASNKVASVRRLARTSAAFGWAQGEMPARALPPILGGFLAAGSGWSPAFGEAFRRSLIGAYDDGQIDLGCVLGHGSFEVPFGASSDDVMIGNAEGSLVSCILRLLQRLQRMGSVPAIDYNAYRRWVEGSAQELAVRLEEGPPVEE